MSESWLTNFLFSGSPRALMTTGLCMRLLPICPLANVATCKIWAMLPPLSRFSSKAFRELSWLPGSSNISTRLVVLVRSAIECPTLWSLGFEGFGCNFLFCVSTVNWACKSSLVLEEVRFCFTSVLLLAGICTDALLFATSRIWSYSKQTPPVTEAMYYRVSEWLIYPNYEICSFDPRLIVKTLASYLWIFVTIFSMCEESGGWLSIELMPSERTNITGFACSFI